METIKAQVSQRLLSKATRLLTGTLAGRNIEILQNARRAGATTVHITNRASRGDTCFSGGDIWYHLGDYIEDDDTHDTQLRYFEEQLELFWATIIGPDEYL